MSAGEIFFCEEKYSWLGWLCQCDKWGDCQLYLDSCPMDRASKSLFSARFIRFSNSRFQDNMHCFVFQQKYVDANTFVLRSQMGHCHENHVERKFISQYCQAIGKCSTKLRYYLGIFPNSGPPTPYLGSHSFIFFVILWNI